MEKRKKKALLPDKNPARRMKIIQTSYKVAVRKGKASEIALITLFRITGLRLRKKVLVRR